MCPSWGGVSTPHSHGMERRGGVRGATHPPRREGEAGQRRFFFPQSQSMAEGRLRVLGGLDVCVTGVCSCLF